MERDKPGLDRIKSTQEFEVRGKLPTLNEILEMAKRNKFEYQRIKKKKTKMIADLVSLQLDPVERAYFLFHWVWTDRRTDEDNIAVGHKFIFDGLVEGGILTNDGWGEVAGWRNTFSVDKHHPRTEVRVLEVENE